MYIVYVIHIIHNGIVCQLQDRVFIYEYMRQMMYGDVAAGRTGHWLPVVDLDPQKGLLLSGDEDDGEAGDGAM